MRKVDVDGDLDLESECQELYYLMARVDLGSGGSRFAIGSSARSLGYCKSLTH